MGKNWHIGGTAAKDQRLDAQDPRVFFHGGTNPSGWTLAELEAKLKKLGDKAPSDFAEALEPLRRARREWKG
ncbi:MAG: hypothetical protein SX243_06550 [Acidobacteriota bacterium]|nr:hypothetical protein [Acidobacteriota bacterium]